MFSSGCEAIPKAFPWPIAFLVSYPECQTDIQHELNEEIGRGKMLKLNHNLSGNPKGHNNGSTFFFASGTEMVASLT